MKNLFFSIIIPIYNRPLLSQRAILSVLKQSYSHYECIIIEDGSSYPLANSFLNFILRDKRFKYLKFKKNKGVSLARNKGIQCSKYQKICFLDSDDQWQKNKLKEDFQFIQKNKMTFIHHSDSIWIRKGKEVNLPIKYNNNSGFIFYQSLKHCMVAMSNIVIDKKIFDRVGFFNKKLKCCEDYELLLKISSLYYIGKINKKLVIRHQNYLGEKIFISFNNKKIIHEISSVENHQLSSDLAMDKFRILALQNFIQFSKNKIFNFFAQQEMIRRYWILIHGLEKKKKIFLSLYYKFLKRIKYES